MVEPQTPDPTVAVVVATFERPDLVVQTIAALDAQTRPADEIVVVDDHSRDRTPEVLAEALSRCRTPTTLIRQEENQGPAVARNRGWRATACDVVAFTDDDCRPHPTWLERLVAGMDGADISQGRIQPDPAQLDRGRPFTRSLEAGGSPFFETANIAFTRGLLEELGGFDERYRFQGGEDTDLGQRALHRGAVTAFVRDALVDHEVFPMGFRDALRNAGRCDQLIQAVVRHPSLHQFFRTRMLLLPHHPRTLVATAGILTAVAAVTARRGGPLVTVAGVAAGAGAAWPWVRFRGRRRPTVRRKLLRVVTLPMQLAVDLTEVFVVLRARVRYRGTQDERPLRYAAPAHDRTP